MLLKHKHVLYSFNVAVQDILHKMSRLPKKMPQIFLQFTHQ